MFLFMAAAVMLGVSTTSPAYLMLAKQSFSSAVACIAALPLSARVSFTDTRAARSGNVLQHWWVRSRAWPVDAAGVAAGLMLCADRVPIVCSHLKVR